jgi:hypothetical protein
MELMVLMKLAMLLVIQYDGAVLMADGAHGSDVTDGAGNANGGKDAACGTDGADGAD